MSETSYTEFPPDFNFEGISKAWIDQHRISREQQVALGVHMRGCIVGATMAAVARNLPYVRFQFHGFLDLLKKGKHVPLFVYLEHSTIVTIVAELMERFKGKVYAGRILATEEDPNTQMRRTWILLEKSASDEFLEGDDCQITLVDQDGGSQ